jgi:hypothetical protein
MPVLERREDPASLRSLRDALSALQMEYAKLAGAAPPAGEGAAADDPAEQPQEGPPGPGPAQKSGRLWVPGS